MTLRSLATLQEAHLTPIPLLWHHRPYDQEERSAHLRGEDLVDLDDALPDPTGKEEDNVYKISMRKIDNHFIPKKNKDYARFQLGELKQRSHERLADCYARVRDMAKKCDYGTHEEDMIRDHLIQIMLHNKLRSKAIRENWVLDRILTEAALDEQTTEQAEAISKKLVDERSSESIKKVNASRWDRQKHSICGRCGNSDRHETCPAIGVTCDHCGKPNHYAKMCLGKSQKPAGRGQGNRDYRSRSNGRSGKREDSKKPKHRIHDARDDRKGANKSGSRPTRRTKHIEYQGQRSDYISTNESDDSSTNSDDECYVEHLKTHHTSQNKISKEKTYTVKINGNDTKVEPGTGSDATTYRKTNT